MWALGNKCCCVVFLLTSCLIVDRKGRSRTNGKFDSRMLLRYPRVLRRVGVSPFDTRFVKKQVWGRVPTFAKINMIINLRPAPMIFTVPEGPGYGFCRTLLCHDD